MGLTQFTYLACFNHKGKPDHPIDLDSVKAQKSGTTPNLKASLINHQKVTICLRIIWEIVPCTLQVAKQLYPIRLGMNQIDHYQLLSDPFGLHLTFKTRPLQWVYYQIASRLIPELGFLLLSPTHPLWQSSIHFELGKKFLIVWNLNNWWWQTFMIVVVPRCTYK